VLAVGLVPDGRHRDTLGFGLAASGQLGLGLVRKTISHAEGVFF